MISIKTVKKTIKELENKYPQEKQRIKIGVNQVAKLWKKEDGNENEFFKFCVDNFAYGEKIDKIFERYNTKYEYIKGHLTALLLKLRIELDEDTGELLNIDRYFANLNLSSHLIEDLFKTKIAFVILLNWELKDLKKTLMNMDKMTRKEWAINRMVKQFESRIPSNVAQKITETYSKSSEFVYSYNIPIKNILYEDNNSIFEEDLKLISHWGLRDQIKLYYSKNDEINFKKQKTIYKTMERIIYGELPYELVKTQKGRYNPFTNEFNGNKNTNIHTERYSYFKNIYLAHREEDRFHLIYKNYIDRIFNGIREIPYEKVEEMFIKLLKDSTAYDIAKIIEKNLKRKLEVFDIWYNQFLTKSQNLNLDEEVNKEYKTLNDFQNKIEEILIKLDFDKETASYLANKIEVDPARGAGHAWGPEMRGEKAHLRTRAIDAKFMNWQSFNTAMHELGHCVEQIFTLYDVDYNLLSGVPNTAFTEAIAFVFQNKSLDILGVKRNEEDKHLKNLQTYWDTREIAGVALVDMYVWKWMYKKKNFTEKQLMQKVIEIAKDIWNKYYQPIFKIKDSPILAIYSHMIFHGLYLPDYPLGHIIAHQIEKHFEKISIGKDMKRICQLGSITPIKWMEEATGNDISVDVLIEDTKNSIKTLIQKK
ncbi:MAG: hypothetical protein N2Z20_00975 [Elusimicrobiales bacterium]|nr:hypothetical protein [Elusimicrobiales bacterium]